MAQREITPEISVPQELDIHLALVRAEFNSDITQRQLASAQAWCDAHGVTYDVRSVAGAYELPWMIAQLLRTGRYSGAVALGCLIEGETPHFDVIMHAVAQALQDVQRDTQLPVGFGVLTVHTYAQAEARITIGEDATRAIVYSLLQRI